MDILIPTLPSTVDPVQSKGILDKIDMDSYRVEKRAMQEIMRPDKDGTMDPITA